MNTKTCSIIALVCGVIGVICGWFLYAYSIVFPIIGLICGICGIVFGVMGMKKAKENNEPKGIAVAGLVCGIVGTVFAGVGLICWIACIASGGAEAVAQQIINS